MPSSADLALGEIIVAKHGIVVRAVNRKRRFSNWYYRNAAHGTGKDHISSPFPRVCRISSIVVNYTLPRIIWDMWMLMTNHRTLLFSLRRFSNSNVACKPLRYTVYKLSVDINFTGDGSWGRHLIQTTNYSGSGAEYRQSQRLGIKPNIFISRH
jgi:hypothetical protein